MLFVKCIFREPRWYSWSHTHLCV